MGWIFRRSLVDARDFDGDLQQAPLIPHSIQMRSIVTNKRVPVR